MDAMPQWCEFFSADEYDIFCTAVDDGLSLYGADGQDIDGGYVEMAAGEPSIEIYPFALSALAARCRESDTAQWSDLCSSRIMAWAEGRLQREWLTETPFNEVEALLEVWLYSRRELMFEAEPDHPDQPFCTQVADGLYACFVAVVPDIADAPTMHSFVPNSAVSAWNLTADELLDSVRRCLRRLPPPVWEKHTTTFVDDQQKLVGSGEVYFGSAPDGVDLPVSAWALIIDEVTPAPLVPAGLLAVPHRHLLLVGLPCIDAEERHFGTKALRRYTAQSCDNAHPDHRISSLYYVYRPPGSFVSNRELRQT
ncbi:hypothetical protein [Nocardia sp. NPDC051463]|uniref:hypothetical protein n=1 Tax=Nocardia sp. NPDC051463 TaxID=3154845 RepID=UPI00344BE396